MFYTVHCSIIANENQQNAQLIYIFANENQQNAQMIYIYYTLDECTHRCITHSVTTHPEDGQTRPKHVGAKN